MWEWDWFDWFRKPYFQFWGLGLKLELGDGGEEIWRGHVGVLYESIINLEQTKHR